MAGILDCCSVPGSKVGFTGTRHNITAFQRETLMGFLVTVRPGEVHYGDCSGADYEMFSMCKVFGIYVVCHPPENPRFRMFTNPDMGVVLPSKPYLVRNMDIVDATDYLVACPREDHEVSRSGTWMTVRYARSSDRTVVLVYPGGRVDIQRPPGVG